LYSIFKYPLSPRSLWRYEGYVREQEKRIGEVSRVFKEEAEKATKERNQEIKRVFSEHLIDDKKSELSRMVRIWVEDISRAQGTIFPEEFHPERMRVVQYHYLPTKGIKLTVLVDKEDYPKLGIE
jgi:hypothetical protein